MRKGEKRYLIFQVLPNVQNGTELQKYYENLAIAAPMKIYMEQACTECIPDEQDLRMVIEGESIQLREKCLGYYFLDTSENGWDLDVGIYDISIQLEFGESTYISDKMQLQIY